ncbi:MAG TPA: ABC transporter ATP-binding protein [Cyclobacteriaceae bacterium]|nr:ABC transporter ATP-binding protein [Cyclobacteriaceae bacterium]
MRTILAQALGLLSAQQRKNGMGMVMLLVLYSLLDFVSIASFLPVILVVIQPDLVQKNFILHELYGGFNFPNTAQFAIAIIICLFVLILAKTWTNQWITFRKASFAYGIGRDLAMRTVDSYFARTYIEFSQSDFSKEVNRMVSSPLAFANNIIIPAGTLFSELIVFFMILGATAFFDVKAFILVCVMLLPAVLIYSRRKMNVRDISTKLGEYYPSLLKRGFEIAEGQVDIRSFQKEQAFRHNFMKAHEQLDKTLVADHTIHTGTARITEVVAAACICAMMIYALGMKTTAQEILVLLGMYATASFRIIPSVNRILAASHQIRINGHVVESLSRITVPASKNEIADLSFQKSITIDNVTYAYANQANLIEGLKLEIKQGEKIAVTGPSGNGKTTLLLLLLGYLRPSSGQMLIDGKVLDHSTEAAWRQHVGYVPQRPFILDGTIASNIAFGDPQADLDTIAALAGDLELAQWISSLPKGIHTEIGERGVKVSGGQLQRISIARALYRNPEVLVLDEVTNQLDPATETGIFQSLLRMCTGKTLIMITHNHEVLGQFDRIVEVNEGRFTEEKRSLDRVR